jgi:FKBP-type peptidyl-prolyl cis-trans isomerase FkpA
MSVTAVPLQPVKRAYKVWLWIGVLAAITIAAALAWTGTRSAVAAKGSNEAFLAWNGSQPGVRSTPSGLQYQVLREGEGPAAKDGDLATASLEGRLRDGTIFQPKAGGQIPVGQGMIAGFTEALKLMNKGSRYRVWLPPKLGYGGEPGAQGHALADKVLIFDLEMQELVPAEQFRQMQMQQMQQMMQQQMQGQGGQPGGPPTGGEGGAPQPR